MNQGSIGQHRAMSQQIARPTCTEPGEVVQWMGAVQAQDYLGALWAVGLRTPGATEAAIEQALAKRHIVRTWPMRGTIHCVAPADVRWMLELLTPRAVQRSQRRLQQLGLDAATLTASTKVIVNALEGGRQVTRPALFSLLESAGISVSGQRGYHILTQLAYARLICFGARDGKQPTFVLLDEWVPNAPSLPRDEALTTLALRYFKGHGPATLDDFVWWSGLTIADAKAGLVPVAVQLGHATVDGQTYYFTEHAAATGDSAPVAALLPPFDEFLIGYRNRAASLDPAHTPLVVPGSNGMFNPIVVIGGRVVGTWKRVLKSDRVLLTFTPFTPWREAEAQAIHAAAACYGDFLGRPVVIDERPAP
jgi:hypothetical protein